MQVKLIVVRGQPQGKCLVFPPGDFVIGRGEECHVRPNSSWVSRQHCILQVSSFGVVLRDLGSTNGTLVNGTRVVGESPLAEGDEVQVGPLVFEVSVEQSTDEILKPPTLVETDIHSSLDTAELRAAGASQSAPETPPVSEMPAPVAQAAAS
jgi:pSer/pThr/pTyr-binding forkhead associated (FHA) protein